MDAFGEEVCGADVGREFLDGVTQHGAWHAGIAGVEILLEPLGVAFASLAQKPAYGFVDEVVGMMQKDVGNGIGVV